MNKQQHQIMNQQHKYQIGAQNQIRSITLLHKGTAIAVMGFLQVAILDTSLHSAIKTIKRVSPPRSVTSISLHLLCIHFSDNICILYDTSHYEALYSTMGTPHDHKGIKPSQDGRFLVYGNDAAMHVWNVYACGIEMLSHKLKFVSCYGVNWCGSQLYLGTGSGQVMVTKLLVYKQLNNAKVPYSHTIKPSTKYIIAVQPISPSKIACIDYALQSFVLCLTDNSFSTLVTISSSIALTKPVTLLCSGGVNNSEWALYFNINDRYYRIGMDGAVGVVGTGQDVGFVREEKDRRVRVLAYSNKYSFYIQDG